MTLTQLNAFVLVARLGSVTAAAAALGVSEPAVSQALSALRQHLGDQLIIRGAGGMTLTPGGARLLSTATQMVALGAEAQAAVREAQGAPEQLRVVATSGIAEFVLGPLLEAFARRYAGPVEFSTSVAATAEMAVLVTNRLADVALGRNVARDPFRDIVSEPVFRCRLVFVAGKGYRPRGGADQPMWLVDPSGADPGSDVGMVLRSLRVPEQRVRVFANQMAAWAAAAGGAGIAPAAAHLVADQVRRGELGLVDMRAPQVDTSWYVTMLHRDRRTPAASALRNFLATPEAMQLMRSPAAGVPPSRFRPPVYVTIWS
jgi:LysR family transcriptional regulator, low CO2-responsive transcriptional regulator